MAHDIFISYSHEDKTVADAVCHRLEASGVRCWIAPRDVEVGKDWDEAILDAITATRIAVIVFSAAANASRHVKNEVAAALNANSIIFPFRIEDVPPTGALRLHLGRTHWLDAITPPIETHIDTLIRSAARVLGTPEPGTDRSPPSVATTPPPRWTSRQRWLYGTVLAVALTLTGAAALRYLSLYRPPNEPSAPSVERQRQALEPVGYVQSITQTVTGQKPGDDPPAPLQPLNRADAVYHGEVLRSDATGKVTIHFFDDSTINLGSDSALTIDKFIYEKPAAKIGVRG